MALLPFVDEERLHKALASLYPDLTPEEGNISFIGYYLMLLISVLNTEFNGANKCPEYRAVLNIGLS